MQATQSRRVALLLLFALALPAQNPFSLSEADEIQLGKQASGAIEKDLVLVTDPSIVKYIDDLGQSLVRKSARANIQYSFKVVNSPEVNAFALPGGYIYVNRGLIEAADNESELAGVLGHEIGHVVLRHGAEQASRASMAQVGLGALGAILGRTKAATITEMGAQMATAGIFMKFSREAERASDRIGAQMMSDAGFQPQGMVTFFTKLGELQKTQPNVVQKFFSSHPAPTERAQNISDLIARPVSATAVEPRDPQAFQRTKTQVAALPRPEVEAAKARAALEAAAKPPATPDATIVARDMARDREIAARFAPVFHQALGPAPRFDYITRFDFDGDWRGDNNWINAENPQFPLKAYVYYAVFESKTHYFVHYAAFHPRDYKGGEKRGATLSELMRTGVKLGGQYDPTGRAGEAVMAHENDLEGVLVVADKNGDRPVIVETLAHNAYLKYVPPGSPYQAEPIRMDGTHAQVFVEAMGHGMEAFADTSAQNTGAPKGFLVYNYTGTAGDPDAARAGSVGYDLLPVYEAFWARSSAGKSEVFGDQHDYGVLMADLGSGPAPLKVGVRGSALNGVVGAANMSRPPWGWFDGSERDRPLGEWFLQPAEVTRRRWQLPESFSTVYDYHPFFGRFR